MKHFYRFLFLVIFLAFSVFIQPSTVEAAPPLDKYKGISLVPRNSTDPSSEQWKQTLRDLKANNVNIVTYILLYRQSTFNSNEIYESHNNPTEASLVESIAYAHSLGLKVQLKPHIDNDDVPQYWRGQIAPTDLNAWFTSYGTMLNNVARIARENGVEELCIGTELFNLTIPRADWPVTPYWTNLIAQVRANYSGTLTYSSVFTLELNQLEFWPQLDYIGIGAYWQLTSEKNPSVAQIKNSWSGINSNIIQPLSTRVNKPVVFTEAGYRSADCATVYSWGDFYCGTGVNMQEQVNAYEALFSYWENQPNMRGVIIWGWEPDPNFGSLNDIAYTPQHKPAQTVMKNWFGGQGSSGPVIPVNSQIVFDNNYQMDWVNWSWDTNLTIVNSPDDANNKVLNMTTTNPWGGVRLNSFIGLNSANLTALNFSIYATQPNAQYGIWLVDSTGQRLATKGLSDYESLVINGWRTYSIPLTDLNAENKIIKDIILQDWSGQTNSTAYLDNINFLQKPTPTPTPTPTPSATPSPSVTPGRGTISANPNPCLIPAGQSLCTAAISWSVPNPTSTVQVRVRETGGLFAQAPSGTQNATWVNINKINMDLYDGPTLIGTVAIQGTTKPGSISANPNPCIIQPGESLCIVTISWSVINPQSDVQIRVRETGGLFAAAPSGQQDATWANANVINMDLYQNGVLIDSVAIQGTPTSSPTPTPSPTPVPDSAAIFENSLSAGWENWSWDGIADMASEIIFKTTSAWGGLRLHNNAGVDTAPYTHLEFDAKSDAENKSYGISLYDENGSQIGQLNLGNYGGTPNVDTYKTYSIPLTDFGPKGIIKDIVIQDWTGNPDSQITIDNILLKTI